MMLALDPYQTNRITNPLNFIYTPQSGALGTIQEEGTADLTSQITNFQEQDPGWTTAIGSGMDPTMNLSNNNDSDLGNFLSRPTRIAEYQWAVGSPLFERINPWQAFLNDPRVAEKIANFELYRSKLHVKMVISGTGFHYGRAIVSYNPFSGFDGITTERNFLDVDIIGASQKPHFFLNPTNNSGGQLDLPFFWPDNYLSLSDTDRNNMGELTLKSFSSLLHANSGNDPVTITVYAWASDVVLTMPTSLTTLTARNYTPQSGNLNSGDEYGKGIISAPASAIAHAAGKFRDVPTIGPYARATEMVAKGAGGLATHWGYSRPPIITDIVQQKPTPAGNMSNTDAADAVQKLSLDSKQELTIDSRTVGLDGEDQMDISRFVQRESYLTRFVMGSAEGPDTLLWNSRVTPSLYGVEGDEIHPTPMAYMSQVFNKWQGTIKYRFQVVKSNFHKGKILIRWDPRAHSSNVQYNTVYSRVIDLAECDDFEITVGWGQSLPFLKCSAMDANAVRYSGSQRLLNDTSGSFNGVLEVAVVNSLVSPAPDSSISFNVFVSACDDMKFGEVHPARMARYNLFPTPGDFTTQSGIIDASAIAGTSEGNTDAPTNPDPIEPIAPTIAVADQTLNVFFGEAPVSIRDLNRRYVLHRYDVVNTNTNFDAKQLRINDKGLGLYPGWDPNGVDRFNSGIPCNISIPTFAQYFSPCYAGWRGGTRTKYMFSGNTDAQPVVSRIGFSNVPRYSEVLTNFNGSAANATKRLSASANANTAGGAATTNIGINDTIEVEIPYYNGTRFSSSRLPSNDFTNGCHSAQIETILYARQVDGAKIKRDVIIKSWKSVGEDFTFFFFTGCPIVYDNKIVISPV